MSSQPAGEKTEKATPKRKREAKEKGQVVKSTEVISAFSLIVMFGGALYFRRYDSSKYRANDEEFLQYGNSGYR